MDNIGIKLFKSDSKEVSLPSIGEEVVEQQKSIMSQSIEGAISGEKVKTLILPEEAMIDKSNIVFDFSEMETISIFQKEALKGLVCKDGDTSLYLYKKNTLVKIGTGHRYLLERLIPLIREQVFGDTVRVFKDFEVGKPVIEMSKKDITQLRLNL